MFNLDVSAVDLSQVTSFVDKFCTECHDEDVQEGNIRLDNLSELGAGAKFNMLSKIEELVYLDEMPPKKKKKRPTNKERDSLLLMVKKFHDHHNVKSKFRKKLKHPNYANYINHESLFSGKIKQKGYTPARRWLISGQIFRKKFESYLGENMKYVGYLMVYNFFNPFTTDNKNSIRYYADRALNGKHISVVKNNIEWMTRFILTEALLKAGLDIPLYPNVTEYSKTPLEFKNIIVHDGAVPDNLIEIAIKYQFQKVLSRTPKIIELKIYKKLFKDLEKLSDKYNALEQTLITVWMEEEIYYRHEFGSGPVDELGRQQLSPQEASGAIAYALTDSPPDTGLIQASGEGRLSKKEDYKREVLRIINMPNFPESSPRLVRFFREFFGYDKATDVFKDSMRFGDYRRVPHILIQEADLIIEHWLKEDKGVFENIIGSNNFFVYHTGDNEKVKKMTERVTADLKNLLKNTKGLNWKEKPFEVIPGSPLLKMNYKTVPNEKTDKEGYDIARKYNRKVKGKVKKILRHLTIAENSVAKGSTPVYYSGPPREIHHLKSWNLERNSWDYKPEQPVEVENRKGILTHPAWLIAHSQNTHTDPVKRGHWIFEHLLAGKVPDIPIGVEANIPEHSKKTLRTRLNAVTKKGDCWRCHQYMNPLGLPFEAFDDFGVYRTEESLEYTENILKEGSIKPSRPNIYKTLPVETHGALIGTGDPSLDGKVKDPFELIEKLAKSERVRQSIIRHAFRYFMGRNEMASDSQALIDADNSYKESGGSFKAVIVSLLTSDSFIYRKATE
jgi:hypothetical protein